MAQRTSGPPRPGEFVIWRLDRQRYAAEWDSGEGAFQVGGRWNSVGTRVVYCSLDAATTILEVAAHTGLRNLGIEPHVLTSAHLDHHTSIRWVEGHEVPEQDWLLPREPKREQQAFGDALLAQHPLVAIPSVISRNSWNLLIALPAGREMYRLRSQEPFVLDPRLHKRG